MWLCVCMYMYVCVYICMCFFFNVLAGYSGYFCCYCTFGFLGAIVGSERVCGEFSEQFST